MLKKAKNLLSRLPISTQLILYFLIGLFICSILLYNILPVLLNYPPDTINTQFDKEVSTIYYKYQFLLIIVGISLLFILYFKISLRKIDNWWKKPNSNITQILEVRKKAMTFSFQSYAYILVVPIIVLLTILMLTGSHPGILLFKIGTIIFSFCTLLGSISFILSKNTLYPVLVETSKYIKMDETRKSFSLKTKLVFQLFPSVLVLALMLSLVGYYRLTVEKSELLNNYYTSSLDSELHKISNNPSINNIENLLSTHYIENNVFSFVENPDGSIQTSNGKELSSFFIKYMHDLSPLHNNTVYETYTVDSQAVIQKITYQGQTYTVGIYFEIASFSSFLLFLGISFVLFLFNLFSIIYFTRSLTKDIQNVSDGLKHIIENDSESNSKLPVTSNDELGTLIVELNEIQDLNKNQVNEIKNSQDKLMERERLASLGQLIGGIAHNLKTPIMSIAGAAEGLNDLIKEYDASVGNPQVTEQDHHDIAKDMSTWVDKIKNYTEYMSDIITAVKGQAVVLSDEQQVSFTIEELVKRVDILMRHELKNALINLITKNEVDSSIELHGNVNSLVQVINNMISNSIQAYNGKTNENIEFIITRQRNNIIFTIKDYAGGLPKEVEQKLFKEMITTKGKNGTGLGLFMSYSNIRAHFNGNITFKTEKDKGTEFNIIIPM